MEKSKEKPQEKPTEARKNANDLNNYWQSVRRLGIICMHFIWSSFSPKFTHYTFLVENRTDFHEFSFNKYKQMEVSAQFIVARYIFFEKEKHIQVKKSKLLTLFVDCFYDHNDLFTYNQLKEINKNSAI